MLIEITLILFLTIALHILIFYFYLIFSYIVTVLQVINNVNKVLVQWTMTFNPFYIFLHISFYLICVKHKNKLKN